MVSISKLIFNTSLQWYIVAWADIVLAAYLSLLCTLQPNMFDTLVLKNEKAGKEFGEWWERMEKYRKLEPPSATTL